MSTGDTQEESELEPGAIWRIRAVFILFIAIAVSVVWVTNHFLTQRFTERSFRPIVQSVMAPMAQVMRRWVPRI